jgi:hypothetical protein
VVRKIQKEFSVIVWIKIKAMKSL